MNYLLKLNKLVQNIILIVCLFVLMVFNGGSDENQRPVASLVIYHNYLCIFCYPSNLIINIWLFTIPSYANLIIPHA